MSVAATIGATLTVVETLETNVPAGATGKKDITHSGFSVANFALNSGTTPAVSKCAFFQPALVAGAYTLDLTALLGTNNVTVNGNGLKPRAVLLKNHTGNSPVNFTEGAANGHALLGTAFLFQLKQKCWSLFYLEDQAPAVGGTDKTWDVTGTGTDVFDVGILLG